MRKYIYFITLLGVLGWMTSCNDDFLERAPLVNLSDANFWQSENDLQIYVNNLYNQGGLLPRYDAYYIVGPYTDDALNGSDTYIQLNYNRRMNGENTLPASGGGWAAGDWSLLRDINYFMDHYQTVSESWDKVKPYVGEALFFRSIFYFNKLRSFGDVPWASSTVGMESKILYEARLPRNQVTDSIMHDLDLAVEYLPARGNGSWTGRITKEVALALQARIALYEGTWERYHAKKNTPFKVNDSDGANFIQKAADVSGALITLAETNGYPALDNANVENGYWRLFNQLDYSSHKEVLLWRKYSIAEGLFHHWAGYSANGQAKGITKSMIDSYLCVDGKPISVSPLYKGDKDLKSVVADRDPRLNQTIYVDDGFHLIWSEPRMEFATPTFESGQEGVSVTGYQLYKGHNSDYTNTQQQFETGCIYFRYAETLLIHAEAKAELGTITQPDIDKTINALRLRVGMDQGLLNINNITTDPYWEFSGLSPLLQEIRRERKVELGCEGFRTDDIFRWAAVDELMFGKRPLGGVKKQWENYPGASELFLSAVEKLNVNEDGYIDPYKDFDIMDAGYQFNLNRDYLSPIPTNELVLNPQLKQNPGW